MGKKGGDLSARLKLLTDNLISMKGEVGELKGKSHTHLSEVGN